MLHVYRERMFLPLHAVESAAIGFKPELPPGVVVAVHPQQPPGQFIPDHQSALGHGGRQQGRNPLNCHVCLPQPGRLWFGGLIAVLWQRRRQASLLCVSHVALPCLGGGLMCFCGPSVLGHDIAKACRHATLDHRQNVAHQRVECRGFGAARIANGATPKMGRLGPAIHLRPPCIADQNRHRCQ